MSNNFYDLENRMTDKESESRQKLREILEETYLLKHYGHHEMLVSSSNAYSHGLYEMSVKEYLARISGEPQTLLANESFYFFGTSITSSPSNWSYH